MAREIIQEEEEGKGPIGIPSPTPPSNPPAFVPQAPKQSGLVLTSTLDGEAEWDVPAPGFTNPFDLSFASGALIPTLKLGAVGNGEWLKIEAADVGAYSDFYGTWASSANVSGPNDDVVMLGHNVNSGGGQVDVTKAAVGISWESHFIAGHDQTEFHLFSWPPNSVPGNVYKQNRFLSHEGHNDDGSTALFIFSSVVNIGSGWNASDPAAISINSTETHVNSPSGTGSLSLLLDDGAKNAILTANNVGGGYGRVTLDGNNGIVLVDASNAGGITGLVRLAGNGGIGVEVGNTYASLIDPSTPNNANQIVMDSNGPRFDVGGNTLFAVQPNQVVVPNHLFYVQKDGVTTADGFAQAVLMRNTTNSTGVVNEHSPALMQTAFGWTGAAARAVSFAQMVLTDGAGAGSLSWRYSTDEGNYAQVGALSSIGNLSLAGGLGVYGVAATTQYVPTQTTAGFVAGTGTAMNADSTSTGGTGTTALTFGDVVALLKRAGLAPA